MAANSRYMRALRAAIGLVVVSTLAPAAAALPLPVAAGAWRKIVSPTALPGRAFHASAYDEARDEIVVFGGGTYDGMRGDTWIYSDGDWRDATPPVSPGPRAYPTMSYDAARERVVLFGGFEVVAGDLVSLDDTWSWDGQTWTQLDPAGRPPPRWGHAMVYDSARRVVVLFGGDRPNGNFRAFYSDTWEWNGSTWTERPTSVAPVGRMLHSMAYDASRHRSVLFGGDNDRGPRNDTWEWDGSEWLQRDTEGGQRPTLRDLAAMAALPAGDGVLLFGGVSDLPFVHYTEMNDAWRWDGTAWTPVATVPAPLPRQGASLVLDRTSGQVVLIGGANSLVQAAIDEVWSFNQL